MSIQVTDLNKSYGSQHVLRGISFAAKPGRVLGFLGLNGAGKTTTMKILSGSLQPDSGTVSVAGLDIRDHSLEVRQRVGYLPENNPLYLDMYVHEALNFMAGLHRLSKSQQRIQEVIAQTGLITEQHKKIRQLSKGYRQRLGIAQAILHNPDVLILDEPTAGLDPSQLTGIRSLIKQLGREKTVLLSTHIMQEVEAVCDDVIILHQGRIVAAQALEELTRSYPGSNLEGFFIKLTASTAG